MSRRKTRIVSLHFDKKYFNKTKIKKWFSRRQNEGYSNFVYPKAKLSHGWYHVPQFPPSQVCVVATKKFSSGVKALLGVPKKGYAW